MSQQLEIINEADVSLLRSAKPPEEEFAEMKALAIKLEADAKKLTVTSVDQKAEMKAAGELRKALKTVRCQIERRHKELKKFYLEGGRRIDAIKNELVGKIEPEEARLAECETFAEREYQRQQMELRNSRLAELEPFAMPGIHTMALNTLTDAEFAELKEQGRQMVEARRLAKEKADADLAAAKEAAAKAQAEAAAKAEAERAEAARLAAEERARHEAERAVLEAERKKQEQEAAAQRELARKAQAAADEANRKLRAAEAARQAELAAERLRQEQEAAAQRERDRLAAEAAERAKTGPDADRLHSLRAPLESLKNHAASLTMASARGREMLTEIRSRISDLEAAVNVRVGALKPFAY